MNWVSSSLSRKSLHWKHRGVFRTFQHSLNLLGAGCNNVAHFSSSGNQQFKEWLSNTHLKGVHLSLCKDHNRHELSDEKLTAVVEHYLQERKLDAVSSILNRFGWYYDIMKVEDYLIILSKLINARDYLGGGLVLRNIIHRHRALPAEGLSDLFEGLLKIKSSDSILLLSKILRDIFETGLHSSLNESQIQGLLAQLQTPLKNTKLDLFESHRIEISKAFHASSLSVACTLDEIPDSTVVLFLLSNYLGFTDLSSRNLFDHVNKLVLRKYAKEVLDVKNDVVEKSFQRVIPPPDEREMVSNHIVSFLGKLDKYSGEESSPFHKSLLQCFYRFQSNIFFRTMSNESSLNSWSVLQRLVFHDRVSDPNSNSLDQYHDDCITVSQAAFSRMYYLVSNMRRTQDVRGKMKLLDELTKYSEYFEVKQRWKRSAFYVKKNRDRMRQRRSLKSLSSSASDTENAFMSKLSSLNFFMDTKNPENNFSVDKTMFNVYSNLASFICDDEPFFIVRPNGAYERFLYRYFCDVFHLQHVYIFRNITQESSSNSTTRGVDFGDNVQFHDSHVEQGCIKIMKSGKISVSGFIQPVTLQAVIQNDAKHGRMRQLDGEIPFFTTLVNGTLGRLSSSYDLRNYALQSVMETNYSLPFSHAQWNSSLSSQLLPSSSSSRNLLTTCGSVSWGLVWADRLSSTEIPLPKGFLSHLLQIACQRRNYNGILETFILAAQEKERWLALYNGSDILKKIEGKSSTSVGSSSSQQGCSSLSIDDQVFVDSFYHQLVKYQPDDFMRKESSNWSTSFNNLESDVHVKIAMDSLSEEDFALGLSTMWDILNSEMISFYQDGIFMEAIRVSSEYSRPSSNAGLPPVFRFLASRKGQTSLTLKAAEKLHNDTSIELMEDDFVAIYRVLAEKSTLLTERELDPLKSLRDWKNAIYSFQLPVNALIDKSFLIRSKLGADFIKLLLFLRVNQKTSIGRDRFIEVVLKKIEMLIADGNVDKDILAFLIRVGTYATIQQQIHGDCDFRKSFDNIYRMLRSLPKDHI